MSNVINKITGQYLKSVNTPDYSGADWIINPTQSQIDQYTPQPTIEQEKASKIAEIEAQADSLINISDKKLKYTYTKSIKLLNKKARGETLTPAEEAFETISESIAENAIAVREREFEMIDDINNSNDINFVKNYVIDFLI